MHRVLLGVCGGISAYKSCELVREFRRRNAEVRVVLTEAAQKFVTKVTFEALSRSPVYTDLFGDGACGTAHIDVARWAEALVIAPLTANTLAQLTHGNASNFLSVIYLAFDGPVIVAPAMNTQMWKHQAVAENLRILRNRGVVVVDPQEGELACGEVGPGRMADPAMIAEAVFSGGAFTSPLRGRKFLITAGPTREYLDPVRFLSSPSSGKMGFAIAREAVRRGANVTVIHGPVTAKADFPARFIPVTTAEEMYNAVEKEAPRDVMIGVAAVSDYRPSFEDARKWKRKDEGRQIALELTPDILARMVQKRRPQDLVVGFAAETENLIPQAQLKRETKNLDLIVANQVDREKQGFEKDHTSVVFIPRKGSPIELDQVSKDRAASELMNQLELLYKNRK